MQHGTKRPREVSINHTGRDSPRKRQKLDLDARQQQQPVKAASIQGYAQTPNADAGSAYSWATKSPECSSLLEFAPTVGSTVGSTPSDLMSPYTPHAFDMSGPQDNDTLSPLDNDTLSPLDTITSPVTEYSEWAPFSPKPGSRTRKLIQHFSDVVSPLLLFDTSKSWMQVRELLVPLATDGESSLTAAICAIASAHLESADGGASSETAATNLYNLALSRLAMRIESRSGLEVTLATIILLVAYEIFVGSRSSDMIERHIRGAYSTLVALQGEQSELIDFLNKQFQFYNVLVGLSVGKEPIGQVPALRGPYFNGANDRNCTPPLPSLNDDLWPVLHRLAAMPGIKRDLATANAQRQASLAAVLRGEITASSLAVEAAFTAWTGMLSERENLSLDSRFILAYSYSGLVYLYRNILGYPQRHQLVQVNSHSALSHCNAIISSGSARGGVLWPLFTAACEVVDSGRGLAKDSFDLKSSQQEMPTSEDAWSVVEEVWKQVDENASKGLRAQDTFTAWRRAEQAMSLRLILA